MRTEVKVLLVVALLVVVAGSLYWANLQEPQKQSIPFDKQAMETSGRSASPMSESGANRGAATPTRGNATPTGANRTAENRSVTPPAVTPPAVTPTQRPDPATTAGNAAPGGSALAGGTPPTTTAPAPLVRRPAPPATETVGGAMTELNPPSASLSGGPEPTSRPALTETTLQPAPLAVEPERRIEPAAGAGRTEAAPRSVENRVAPRTVQPEGAQPVRPQPATPVQAPEKTYVVTEGDTLTYIAETVYGDGKLWPKIKAANPGMDENRLLVGQKLVIPPKEGRPSTPSEARRSEPRESTPRLTATREPAPGAGDPPRASESPRVYVIGKGDTLLRIARNVLKDEKRWREIYDLNRDVLKNPDVLPAGVKLKLPASRPSREARVEKPTTSARP